MNLDTYCIKDYVLKIQVKAMERSGPWWQFSIMVQTVFRTGSTPRIRRGPRALWVPDRDLGCGCPSLHVGRTFLLIGSEEGGRDWAPEESRLVADRCHHGPAVAGTLEPQAQGLPGSGQEGPLPPEVPPPTPASPRQRGTMEGLHPPASGGGERGQNARAAGTDAAQEHGSGSDGRAWRTTTREPGAADFHSSGPHRSGLHNNSGPRKNVQTPQLLRNPRRRPPL
ncbi:hypothetical protein CRUP_027365 [Coryphaenoides rupestris]|nr:hypothetical protein CRUP_027365 [Coryphaenoides rupestris]